MPERARRQAVLIAGPTASGKSALAIARARDGGGIIVNADAMQVYGTLRVLTARPSPEEEGQAPHRLYGTVPPSERFSTGAWSAAAEAVIQQTAASGEPIIFVGGTGLYFAALEAGIAAVPEVPATVVAAVSEEVAGLGPAERGALIAARDPAMAARLRSPDPQRVIRALAVLRHTGHSLADYQDAEARGLLSDFDVERTVLNPPRDFLRERIAGRFSAMLESGAVEEVEEVLALGLDPGLPAMKAIGVREIGDWLAGRATRDEMVERAVVATRQYAKRQRTWFRARMGDWTWRSSSDV